MYIDIVPNRNSRPAILLRESIRQGSKIVKRTLANLSSLTLEQAHSIRDVLKGNPLCQPDDLFEIVRSRTHGAVRAVEETMRKLRLSGLLDRGDSRERDLVMGMIAARLLDPQSKLATTRSWDHSTLGEAFGVSGADEDELYAAMDWLLERQPAIERRLAKRHMKDGARVLYDLSSSYFEGESCPLAARGYSRDGKKGKLQVNYGLLTDARGCPVAISVFKGNTSDPLTLLPQVEKLRNDFKLDSVVLVGDRGMISQKQIDDLSERSGVDWITALKSGAIRKLIDNGQIQLDFFDEHNLFECAHPDFPGERLIVCRNPALARLRTEKRNSLLAATERELEKVQRMVAGGRLKDPDKIGVRVGKVINKHKMAKHFVLGIEEGAFHFQRDDNKITEETALDGLYVIRTSLEKEQVGAAEAVGYYKDLSRVEEAFRTLKSNDLEIRPIRHRTEDRVRAHLFLCVLAYYVKWYMTEAWRPLLFADDHLHERDNRNPVAPATRSDSALKKASDKCLDDGMPVHSFRTLMSDLATIVRNVCRRKDVIGDDATFVLDTKPTPLQEKAFRLLKEIQL